MTGQPSALDLNCDGRDEDCDGSVDEDYVPQPTQCGRGACAAAGQIVCIGGVATEACTPLTPGSTVDATCNGVDEDCDGSLDEDYAVSPTTCGSGVCMGQGDLRCVSGVVVDTCQLRPSCEANCHDESDDDGDGRIDCRDSDCAVQCEIYCADGADDDGDGEADCADSDCAGQTGCVAEVCGNSLDDDGDGLIDCADLLDCTGAAACPDVPPDAATVAPPLDPAASYGLLDRVRFVFEGADPIQRGVLPGTIQGAQVSVVHGAARLRDGRPLPGVQVRVAGKPEFGVTHTNNQGQFLLVLNGGGLVTLDYTLPGYISAQRQVTVRWQNSGTVEDIVMLPRSPVVSTIDVSGTSADYQVSVARMESDVDGSRRALVVFPPGVAAQVFDASGAAVNVPSLDLRLTEVTAGANGPAAMPAELPPSSAFTYAIDITPDEAHGVKVHGRDTILSAPVYFYVDNFLSFPAGAPVPTGYYDEQDSAWKAIDNGIVIDLVGETAGLAEIDTNGDGVAESSTALAALAITEGERRVLAAQYAPGASIWRVQLPHLSLYDMNMGAGPDGMEAPPGPPDDETTTANGPPNDPNKPDCDTSGSPNSIVDCFNQVLSEHVPVAGTPYKLHYRSDRVPGRLASRSITIPVRTPTLDAKLAAGPGGTCLRWGVSAAGSSGGSQGGTGAIQVVYCAERTPTHAIVEITPAGQKTIKQRWPAEAAPPSITYTWEGKDDFGRTMVGPVPVAIRVAYEYGCSYTAPARFGQYGGARLDFNGTRTYTPRSDCSVQLVRDGVQTLEYWDYRDSGIGGWSLDVQHRASPANEVIYGDGRRSNTDKTPATEAAIVQSDPVAFTPGRFAIDRQGTIYVVRDLGVYKQVYGGSLQLVAPTSSCTLDPNQARLCGPTSIAVASNGDLYVGDLYIQGSGLARIMRITPGGSIQRYAGATRGYSPEGGHVLSVSFRHVSDLEISDDGTLYFLDAETRTVHRVGTDGIVQRIAGNSGGAGAFITTAEDARTVPLDFGTPAGWKKSTGGIALDTEHDGLIIAETGFTSCSIRHLSTTGRLTTILRQEGCGQWGPNMPFSDAVVGAAGQLVLSAASWHGVYAVDRSGQLEHLAGVRPPAQSPGEQPPYCSPAGFYPTRLYLGQVRSVAKGPDGYVYFSHVCGDGTFRVERLRTARPAARLLRSVSPDAREVYEFNEEGRHLRTLSQLTGAELRHFEYDAGGRLDAVVEADSNRTTVEYDANGKPVAVVAPFGQRTTLQVDANSYLSRIETEPDLAIYQFAYDTSGLMTQQIDPRGSVHSYGYDELGRINLDEDPAGGSFTFSVVNTPRVLTVTRRSALGQVMTYDWRSNANGTSRYSVTFPTGRSNIKQVELEGTSTATMIDGTILRTAPQPDPTFGMFAPVHTVTVTAPNGLVRTLTQTRTTTVGSDGSASMTETLNDTGRTSSRSFDPSTRTWTITSAEGRTSHVGWDVLGRVVSTDSTGTLPTTYRYDSRGRVDRVVQGSGRFLDNVFDPASGYLASMTDALAQTTAFETDTLGRVTSITGPDESLTTYEYDGEGHLTGLTPPERPKHQLGYTPVDLLEDYTAPSVGTGATQTHTAYDLDRRPTVITQPDGLQQTFSYHPTTGLLTSSTVPGAGTSTYGYDTRDRLSSVTRPGAGSVTFGYNGDLMTSLTVSGPHSVNDGATTNWSGNVSGAVLFGHDNTFHVKSIEVRGAAGAPSGFAAQYTRDKDDLLTAIAPLVTGTGVPTMTITRSPLDGHVMRQRSGS